MFATDFPHIECDWPNTRPFAERLFEGVPADEAFKIASRQHAGLLSPARHADGPRGPGPARMTPRFGLNRFDSRSVAAFAADVARAETLGWDAALVPDSQLRRRDTYVMLAAAAQSTTAHHAGDAAGQSRQPPSQCHRRRRSRRSTSWRRAASCSAGASATPPSGSPACARRGSRSWRTARGSCARSSTANPSRSARRGRRACRTIARADLDRGGRAAHAAHGRRRRRRRLHPCRHAPGKSQDLGRRHPRRCRRGRAAIRPRSAGRRDLPHGPHGRSGARAADGQVDGRRLLRVLADALRPARPSLDRPRSRDAQARAPGLAGLPPRPRPRAQRPRRRFPPARKPPTPSASAAAPGEIVKQL